MTTAITAALPAARGPLSDTVIDALGSDERRDFPELPETAAADPFGEDLQLALHVCYELHYQGFAGVDPDWEWDPELLRLRAAMERVFLAALRAHTPGGDDVAEALAPLLVEPVHGTGLSHHLAADGTWEQVREYFALRSVYHHKEADPHAWVIPRLRGKPKAALVAVEFDEYGGGRPGQVHAQLYADLLDGAGLNSQYLHYLDHAPAVMLAVVNMMSLFGLHRRFRGALAGHFAAAEITTAPSAQRLEKALRRLGADERCRYFYAEHVEADAVHEQVMRRDVLGGLLETEPELAGDIVFGIQATGLVEQRFADHLLGAWHEGRSALRKPL